MDWQNFDWNRARAFLVTAREGSYSAAARALGVAQPTVGRQVAALEEELGVTLFEKVGRGLELTATGLELADHVTAMGEAASRMSLAAAGQSTSLEGVVRVTASETISAFILPEAVAVLRSRHPGIELELVASNEVQDLRRREADIAVRGFRPQDPELVARKVDDGVARPYATPEYLERVGGDLEQAEFFGFDRTDVMIEGLRHIGLALTQENFPIVTANHLVQWSLCKRGLGVCIMLERVGDADPDVVRARPDGPGLPVPTWLTCHRELRTSRRLRVVFDVLAEVLGARGREDAPRKG